MVIRDTQNVLYRRPLFPTQLKYVYTHNVDFNPHQSSILNFCIVTMGSLEVLCFIRTEFRKWGQIKTFHNAIVNLGHAILYNTVIKGTKVLALSALCE